MVFPIPLSTVSSTVLSVLIPAIIGSVASLATALLARPRQASEIGKNDAEAQAQRIAADTSLSAEARQWVGQAMERVADAERRADNAEKKADEADRKADECARTLREHTQHTGEQQRLQRTWIVLLSDQVESLGGTPVLPPKGLDP